MYETLVEVIPELVFGVLASGLTLIGLVAENAGLHNLNGGHTTIGLWMAAVGIVAIYAGFKVAREKVVPGIRAA